MAPRTSIRAARRGGQHPGEQPGDARHHEVGKQLADRDGGVQVEAAAQGADRGPAEDDAQRDADDAAEHGDQRRLPADHRGDLTAGGTHRAQGRWPMLRAAAQPTPACAPTPRACGASNGTSGPCTSDTGW
jgi:hypothetical protein